MRIVQIIDSLEVGGAEKMAINFANALQSQIEFSGLVATRREGAQKIYIAAGVSYLFLKKTKTVDYAAAWRLRNYCKANRITHMHAHSSSYFIAFLTKMMLPRTKIIWHDHNGMSEFLASGEFFPLKIASFFFKGIVVVNQKLKDWANKDLHCRHVMYLPNFTNPDMTTPVEGELKGEKGKRILCLANLREQKDHLMLLKVAVKVRKSHPDWTFHLVGKDFMDAYSESVHKAVKKLGLQTSVFIYGTRNDTHHVIQESEIGILTSRSEGLPVSLLEYGIFCKPVVVTAVGEIPLIIENGENGFIKSHGDVAGFYGALVQLINDPDLRQKMGENICRTIQDKNSESAVMHSYLSWLNEI